MSRNKGKNNRVIRQLNQNINSLNEQVASLNAKIDFLISYLSPRFNILEESEKDFLEKAEQLLWELRIDHAKRYIYMREAILLLYQQPNLIDNLNEGLYVKVAQNHSGISPKTVGRDIRFLTDYAWRERENSRLWKEIFSDDMKKPRTREIFTKIMRYLQT